MVSAIYSTLFSIEVHYGGKFIELPYKKYVGGSTVYIDWVDAEKISIPEIHCMAKEIGCADVRACWYRVPAMDIISELRVLEYNRDILSMVEWIPTYRVIEIYLDHEATIYEMQGQVQSSTSDSNFDPDNASTSSASSSEFANNTDNELNEDEVLIDTIVDNAPKCSGMRSN